MTITNKCNRVQISHTLKMEDLTNRQANSSIIGARVTKTFQSLRTDASSTRGCKTEADAAIDAPKAAAFLCCELQIAIYYYTSFFKMAPHEWQPVPAAPLSLLLLSFYSYFNFFCVFAAVAL